MASASNTARLCARACWRAPSLLPLPRGRGTRLNAQPRLAQRPFGTSSTRWRPDRDENGAKPDGPASEAYGELKLDVMNRLIAEESTPERLRQLDELAKENGFNSVEDYVYDHLRSTKSSAADRELTEKLDLINKGKKMNRGAFWYDEDNPNDETPDEKFDEDDITSMAHGKLDEIREVRQYARLAVWELPLLSKFAKPFEPPTENQVLRWRYTTYMGEEHPAEKKVVVQFAPDDLGLTAVQADKLKKLAGARYNPETELVKMSSESFEHAAQNKRYLSNLVDDLITAAKDPSDTFEDIPLDLRHHTSKVKPRFPPEWRLTEERKEQLDSMRHREAISETQRMQQGLLVNGLETIEQHLRLKMIKEQEQREREASTVPVGRGGGGRLRHHSR